MEIDNDQLIEKNLTVDITDYLMIIRKRFFQIVLIFLLVFFAIIAYTIKQPPVYQAICKIKISTRQPMATIEGAQITWYGAKGNEITSEIQLISNKRALLQNVINILNHRELETAFTKKEIRELFTEREIAIIKELRFSSEERKYIRSLTPEKLRASLSIEPIPQTNIVELKVNGPYANVVAAAANILALVYKGDFVRSKIQEAENTKNFIQRQLERLKKELESTKTNIKQVSKESAFLGSIKVYQTELANLRIELDKLREKYKPTHPKIIKLKKLIKTVEEQLAKFPTVKEEYNDKVTEREAKQVFRKTLGEHLITAKINYEAKKEKAKDEIQIIAKAISADKLKPNMKINIFIAFFFGIILGCVSAFVWEGLDTSIGKIEDVERITKLPVIAHIPIIGEKTHESTFFRPVKVIWKLLKRLIYATLPIKRKEEPLVFENRIIFNFDSLSVESEAYRTLRTNIHFAIGTKKEEGNVIAITSTSPKEGKTLTSTNLAIGLAQMGKMTLLLEADMRCPQIARMFRISETPGLSDYLIATADKNSAVRTITDILLGNAEWEKLMSTQNIDNLHIMPAGSIPPNPTELLISDEFSGLIADLRKEYEFIIIDTPPVLPVSDASIIGQFVDGTVLIYQSDKTSRHLLLRAIQTLKKNNTKLVGIVINQLSFDVVMQTQKGAYAYGYRRPVAE